MTSQPASSSASTSGIERGPLRDAERRRGDTVSTGSTAGGHAWQDVGHYPATYRQPNGGAFAVAVNAWLDWHLKGDVGEQDVPRVELRLV